MKMLILIIVFISLMICNIAVAEENTAAKELSYEKISCLVGDSVMFLTVPMDSNWDILQMEDAAKEVCESMVLVRVIPGQVINAEEE